MYVHAGKAALCIVAAVVGLVGTTPLACAGGTQSAQDNHPKRASFARVKASRDVRHIADWVVDSGDNRSMPFIVVDKSNARVFVFDTNGRVQGASPALLGLARGDDSVPGIGERELADIPEQDRTTPAGRFVGEVGRRASGEDIIWIDYSTSFSMHRVLTNNPKERRLERLATPTIADNRISFGCINLPVKFYETVVRPAFDDGKAVVYVLPETRAVRQVFESYDVDEHRPTRVAESSAPENAIRAVADYSSPVAASAGQ